MQRLGSLSRSTPLRAALLILTDLAYQRWPIRVTADGSVEVRRPEEQRLEPLREKERIRKQELVKRDEQLREPSTRRFVSGLEASRLYKGRRVSIFSLMRDGRELAAALRRVRSSDPAAVIPNLRQIVDPYLQFVDGDATCEHTGLALQDIWRYFRHTWSNQYTSTPGRTMGFLVRDRAGDCHPIVGIGALGSPIVQIRERDAWIGWHPDAFLEFAAEEGSATLAAWLTKTVDASIDECYSDDFIEEQLLTRGDIRNPSVDVNERLKAYGERQRELHHRLARSKEMKRSARSDGESAGVHWRKQARSHLYRSKRALALADMFRVKLALRRFLPEDPTAEDVRALLKDQEGRQAVKTLLRKAKADRVGIAMADITVCGAVAPYGPILGGKLVSMLAASPEVIAAYRQRYSNQQSEIASSMAGRPIVRPSHLVFLGTTSLYGVGSSQYNRLRMSAAPLGGRADEQLAFLELGRSGSYGTSHFGSATVEALVALVQQSLTGQRVNSIFGEGVSPKLRKIRDGLDRLKLPTDALLMHGRHRIVYGVPLIRNLREYLLGMDRDPDYLFDLSDPTAGTRAVVSWWMERWLASRLQNDDALGKVEDHSLVRPIRHGARVILSPEDPNQTSLFDDL
ncbi:Druantia anti-phage system protein DruA [Teichococcus vastitatis]|uniref:DUF4338 domain-containing protein n=1 Tax=Teichococcus vastitatis TaxID=2307076 RepID=A0ABS9VZH2_9PROT|nr:Druantia anti-phage system protein DruA [Pseudoroseomonas vastitatis]MCI0752153.1 DUF4338 domain-containing protein [Pseudoroseomonas vastitatis]